jgi:hypothetical protein
MKMCLILLAGLQAREMCVAGDSNVRTRGAKSVSAFTHPTLSIQRSAFTTKNLKALPALFPINRPAIIATATETINIKIDHPLLAEMSNYF